MPASVRTPSDEKKWGQAKQAAASQGHAKDWAYIQAVFQRIKKHLGGKKPAK